MEDETTASLLREEPEKELWPARYDVTCPVFIDGHTLLDEFAYSYHFHSKPMTRLLHALGFVLMVYGASMVLLYPQWTVLTVLTVLVALVYDTWMIYLERAAGSVVALSVLALWGAAYVSVVANATTAVPIVVGVLLSLCVAPIMQLYAGHVLVEQSMASRWRPMETLCSTPLLVVILLLHSITRGSYADALVQEIKRRAEVDRPYFRADV